MVEGSRSGNPFNDKNHLIARLDVFARNSNLQEKLKSSIEWDLMIVDEAHRMSATYSGGEVKTTKRYQLGQMPSRVVVIFYSCRQRHTTARKKIFSFSWRCWMETALRVPFGMVSMLLMWKT